MAEWINKVWCIRAMKYYSALNRNEFLTHATAWMNLEGIMLSEIARRKRTNTVLFHLHEGPGVVLIKLENRMVVARSG